MDAGFLDMLHDAGHIYFISVRKRVNVNFDGMLQKLVDQDWMLGLFGHLLLKIGRKLVIVINHGHGPAAKHIAWTHDHGIGNSPGNGLRLLQIHGRAVGRLQKAEFFNQGLKAFPVFCPVNSIRAGAHYRHAGAHQGHGQVERRLAAKLHDDPVGPFLFDYVHHVFKGQGLKIEAVRGVIVGRDSFGIGIYHDGRDAGVPEGEAGMAAAVVEFDALAYAVGAAAQNQHLGLVADFDFAAALVGGIEIGSVGLELAGAGIHQIVGGLDAGFAPYSPYVGLRPFPHFGQLPVRKAVFLCLAQNLGQFGIGWRHVAFYAKIADSFLHLHNVVKLADKPGVNARGPEDFVLAHAGKQGVAHCENPAGIGHAQVFQDSVAGRQGGAEVVAKAGRADFHGAQAFLQGFLECAANAHGLAHAFHRSCQLVLCAGEFLEGEARNLENDIVDGRLETGHGLARDVVAQFVERVANRQLGRDLGNGKARGLGGQGGGDSFR